MGIKSTLRINKKIVAAYGSVGIFIVGAVMAGLTVLKIHYLQQLQEEQAQISQQVNEKRAKAVEEARKEGKSDYSFFIDKAPIPISQ